MIITKVQYKFLADFNKKAKYSSKNNEVLSKYNRQKVTLAQLRELFIKHNMLIPSQPYKSKNPDDNFDDSGVLEIKHINNFLEECGLNQLIISDNNYYVLSQDGRNSIEEYLVDRKTRVTLPIIAIVISSLSFLIALIAIIVPYL